MDKKCSNCGQPIPEESSFCLHCFTIINKRTDETLVHTNKKTDKNKKLMIVIVIFIVLVSMFSIAAIAFWNNETNKKAENIDPPISTKSTLTTYSQTTQQSPITEKLTTETSTTTTTTTQTTTETTTENTAITTTSTTKKVTTTKATTSAPRVIINGDTLTDYPADKKNSSYTIPYKVSKISNNAFNNNKYIKTLIFSKREIVECDWANLFSNLPNLEIVYVYPGTSADLEGLQYFHGEIIYFG